VIDETELPATDPVRFDPAPIVDAIDEFHRRRFGAAARHDRLSASRTES
jgi:hypothetical protein